MTAETDKAALRDNLVRACFDPGSFIGPRGVRTTDEWRADACLHFLSPILAQAEADRAEIERLKAVLDFEKRARRVAEARADRLAAEVEAHEGVMKSIKAWIDTDLPAGTPGAGTAHMAISKALARAADKPGERTDSPVAAQEGQPDGLR